MQAFSTLSTHGAFGGVQGFYQHDSAVIGLPMRVGVFRPAQPAAGRLPVLFYLAGLTCNEETFAFKAGAQRVASELGMVIVTPDTSPRATGIAGATGDWEIGEGAGFYLDAVTTPWRERFRMESYLVNELLPLLLTQFPLDPSRVGIFGHSMGGHGALTLALRHPDVFRSVSALAPICAPSQCAWGEKAFSTYLGTDRDAWAAHDACALIRARRAHFTQGILVDQGMSDKFLAAGQLQPEKLRAACEAAGQPLSLREHQGYDHGYYFVSTFVEDHLRFHLRVLAGANT